MVKPLSDEDLRMLSHYAAGTGMAEIASMLGLEREEVMERMGQLAGFERKKAGELLVRHNRPRPVKAAPRELARFVEPPPPPEPEPVRAADPEFDDFIPAREPEVRVEPREGRPRPSVDDILRRADEVGGAKFQRKVERIRTMAADLGRELAAAEEVLEAERKVAALRRQLDVANAKLRELRGAPSPRSDDPTPRELRTWAAENGVECSTHGRVQESVLVAYRKAMGGA